MVKSISINNQDIQVKRYNGQMVVTFKDIDLVHGRADGTARKRFNDNRQHFIEGTDFYVVDQPSEIRTLGITRPQGGVPKKLILIAESGYLMLVKSFTDNLAWEVQRQLVNSYFRCKEETAQNNTPYEYFDKTYNGIPVLTARDIEFLTGIKRTTIDYYLKKRTQQGKDYYALTEEQLKEFKKENPKFTRWAGHLNVVTKSGFVKICQTYGVEVEQPKCFEEKAEQPKDISEKTLESIKKARNETIAINVLLDAVDRLLRLKNDKETPAMSKVIYEHYAPAFETVLGYFMVRINLE